MVLDEAFKRLSEDELDALIMIPVWITLLITGADDVYSKAEIKSSIRLIIQNKKNDDNLFDRYYSLVRKKFEVNLKGDTLLLPVEESLRTELIVSKIVHVNELFKKLPQDCVKSLYWSYRDLANKIAKASGGLFGLLSISYSESKYIDLKMINYPAE